MLGTCLAPACGGGGPPSPQLAGVAPSAASAGGAARFLGGRLRGGCRKAEGHGSAEDAGDQADCGGVESGVMGGVEWEARDCDGEPPVVYDGPLPTNRPHFVVRDPEFLRAAAEKNPKEPQAWAMLATSLLNAPSRDQEGALNAYRRALELDPDHVLALNNVGHIHFSRSETRDAEAAYRKVSKPETLKP